MKRILSKRNIVLCLLILLVRGQSDHQHSLNLILRGPSSIENSIKVDTNDKSTKKIEEKMVDNSQEKNKIGEILKTTSVSVEESKDKTDKEKDKNSKIEKKSDLNDATKKESREEVLARLKEEAEIIKLKKQILKDKKELDICEDCLVKNDWVLNDNKGVMAQIQNLTKTFEQHLLVSQIENQKFLTSMAQDPFINRYDFQQSAFNQQLETYKILNEAKLTLMKDHYENSLLQSRYSQIMDRTSWDSDFGFNNYGQLNSAYLSPIYPRQTYENFSSRQFHLGNSGLINGAVDPLSNSIHSVFIP